MRRIAEQVDSIAQRFSVSWVELWKQLGFAKALALAVIVFLPLFKYQILPRLCTRAVNEVAQGYGIVVEAGTWKADLLDLRATVKEVRVKARGRYAREDVLQAESVTVDLSLWGLLSTGRSVNEIVVERPTIYLERQLSGRWNWEELLDSGVLRRGADGKIQLASLTGDAEDLEIRAPRIKLDDARVRWVENVPARSGGGVVQSQKAEIYLDDVTLLLNNVFLPTSGSEPPLVFEANGRIGDGVFSIRGQRRRAAEAVRAGVFTVSLRTAPELQARIHLDNVGAAAIATIVHRARLVPRTGSVRGDIDLLVGPRVIQCVTRLEFENVQYAPDFGGDPALRRREQNVRAILSELPISDSFTVECGGERDDRNYRVADAIQFAVTKEAMREAPPVVRAVAALDEKQLEQPDEEITSDELSAELKTLGVSDEVTSRVEQAGAFTRGVKRVKEGFKRLTR